MSQEAQNENLKYRTAESAAPDKVQTVDLMAKIREQVKAEIAKHGRASSNTFKPRVADANAGNFRAGALLHSEELAYLNSNYAYGILDLDRIKSHRSGIIGKLIVKIKRKILAWFWDSLLKDYFQKEREFQANLVRLLNNTTRYVDERDAANFWELIRKIDVDTSNALERIERIADEQVGNQLSLEKRLSSELYSALRDLQSQVTQLRAAAEMQAVQIGTQETVISGIESLIARASKVNAERPDSDVSYSLDAKVNVLAEGLASKDYSYLMLENRFRGSEDEIAARQKFYAEIFAAAKPELDILDVGCGRGELLQALQNEQVSAYGIDLDSAMVELCQSKGLKAQQADLHSHLNALTDNSLGGLIALQVVEHLNMQQLQELFELCCHKVKSGGKVIFETINPRSILALSSNYFRDPTHVWPLHPDTLAYLMSLSGLKIVETKFLSAVPQEAQLKEISASNQLTPRYSELLASINQNTKQINDLLYGYQDYCIVAEVR